MVKTIYVILLMILAALGLMIQAKATPISTAEENRRYVSQLYKDLLRRNASSAELGALTDLAGSSGRASAVKYVQGSVERYGVLVNDLYQRFLRRNPAPGEASNWVNVLRKNGSTEQVIAAIAASNESYGRQRNAPSWVQSLYKGLLGRSPAGNESKIGVGIVNSVSSRTQFVLNILGSSESRTASIQGLYDGLLNRRANAAELGYWQAMLGKGIGAEGARTVILASDEYFLHAQWEAQRR